MDRTPFFRQCVEIYEEECEKVTKGGKQRLETTATSGKHHKSKFDTSGKFVHDSVLTAGAIGELATFLTSIEKDYMLWDSKDMTEETKDRLDTNVKIQLSGLNKRVSSLKSYAEVLNKRDDHDSGVSLHEIGKNLTTMGRYSQKEQQEKATIAQMRLNTVKALGLQLASVSERFVGMNGKRMARKAEHDKSYLSTSFQYQNGEKSTEVGGFPEEMETTPINGPETTGEVSESYNELGNTLTSQQLQQLTKENQDIQLKMKDEHLKTVKEVETSAIEVSQMVNEISLQLNLQNDSINTLSGDQDDIMTNMHMGNRQLTKANERSRNSGRNLSMLILMLAVILLMIDYIL